MSSTFENNLKTFQCDFSDVNSAEDSLNSLLADGEFNPDVVVHAISAAIDNCRAVDLDWSKINEENLLKLSPLFLKIKFITILTEYCTGTPPKGLSHYVAAKYALMGMSKSLAVELSEYGSTVNMVSPGLVETPLTSYLPKKLVEITAQSNPMKRNACPQDVSKVIGFLASDRSDYLNGINVVVNGGAVMI